MKNNYIKTESWKKVFHDEFIRVTTMLKCLGYDLTKIYIVEGRDDDRERVSKVSKQDNE